MFIVSRVFSRRKRFRTFSQPASVPRKRPFPESSRVFPRPSIYPFVKAKPVFTLRFYESSEAPRVQSTETFVAIGICTNIHGFQGCLVKPYRVFVRRFQQFRTSSFFSNWPTAILGLFLIRRKANRTRRRRLLSTFGVLWFLLRLLRL